MLGRQITLGLKYARVKFSELTQSIQIIATILENMKHKGKEGAPARLGFPDRRAWISTSFPLTLSLSLPCSLSLALSLSLFLSLSFLFFLSISLFCSLYISTFSFTFIAVFLYPFASVFTTVSTLLESFVSLVH